MYSNPNNITGSQTPRNIYLHIVSSVAYINKTRSHHFHTYHAHMHSVRRRGDEELSATVREKLASKRETNRKLSGNWKMYFAIKANARSNCLWVVEEYTFERRRRINKQENLVNVNNTIVHTMCILFVHA